MESEKWGDLEYNFVLIERRCDPYVKCHLRNIEHKGAGGAPQLELERMRNQMPAWPFESAKCELKRQSCGAI